MKTTIQRRIESSEMDFSMDSTVYNIGNIFMNVANWDSKNKNLDVEALLKKGLTWVSLRMYLKVNRFPHNEEVITAETWVENCTRIATQRNCTILDTTGNHLVDITSLWTLLDFETRRPVNILERLPEFAEQCITDEKSIQRQPEKVHHITNGDLVGTHTVTFSDLDCNMHTTSFHYVMWMMDAISLDEHKQKQINELEINFLKECRYGETISIYRENISDSEAIFELRNTEGDVLNRQKVTFCKRK